MNNTVDLENEYLSLKIDTNHGGKIISILDKKNYTEWVWFKKNKQESFKPKKFSDYDSQWIGGYEELYPNDKVEEFDGIKAPDHGELWPVSWNVLNKCENNVELFCKGYFTNSLIFKNIILDEKKITVKYKILEIKSDKYLFKLHLALPINKNKIIFQYDHFKKVDENFGNIVTNNGIENFLTDVTTDQGSNDFLYFYGVNGKIEIQDGDFNSIFLDYDKKSLPYFWIFQSRGGWNDLNVNVLEPCNSGLKDIESARNQNLLYCPPNQYKTWYSLEVT